MSIRIFFLLFAFCVSATAQSLPDDVSVRVGRAQTFVYNWTPQQYKTKLQTRDLIWDNHPTSAQGYALSLPAGVFSSVYGAIDRVPANASAYGLGLRIINACGIAAGGCPLAWFRANHPEWIIYKSDQVTPAYQFSDKTWIPLDISNAAVQQWWLANFAAPLLAAGYNAVSVDNVTVRNDWDERGVCSIAPVTNCTADGGVWTELYSGAINNDATFVSNRVAWSRAITAFTHKLNKSTMANVTYDTVNPVGTASLIAAYDIWFDEPGFTGDPTPSTCNATSSSSVTGAAWIAKVEFITKLDSGRGPNAYVSMNSICPIGAQATGSRTNFELMEYVVASYLIVKNAHTYLAPYFAKADGVGNSSYFTDETEGGAWPQMSLVHGSASGAYTVTGYVFARKFANALALVNPSITMTRYELGSSVYHRSDCTRHTGTVTLPPLSGMVLIKGEPTACVPRE